MIGIIGAMEIEIEKIAEKMENPTSRTVSGIKYTHGFIGEKEVVCAVCGIGKVFAAICAQTMLLLYKAECIINTGVAGTLCPELGVLDAAVATALVQHDMDTSHLGDPVGLISGINVVRICADEALSERLCRAAKKEGVNALCGIIASGDCFVASAEKKEYIQKTFNAVACEMEGAAIAQVCFVNKVPFSVLRTISDGANDGAAMDYPTFARIAAQKSSDIILRFIKEF